MSIAQQHLIEDVKISQKVNSTLRLAYLEKRIGNSEHILRLISERLQAGLAKDQETKINNPSTWLMSPEDIHHLSESLYYVNCVLSTFKEEPNHVTTT